MNRTTALAGGGTVLTEGGHLKEPLGMVLAPTATSSPRTAATATSSRPRLRAQIAVQTADRKTGAGSPFGLAVSLAGNSVYYVDDGENTLSLLH